MTGRGRSAFVRGAAFPRCARIAIVGSGVATVIAETLALFLSVASTGIPRAQPAIEVPDNFARARRGLLPRKVVRSRPPPRGRRMVLRPEPPTWLGEPGAPTDPALDGAVEQAVDTAAEPLAARVELATAVVPDGAPPEVRAALEGADVELLLVRRLAEPEGAAVEATLGEPELEVVVVRRPPDAVP